MHDGIEENNAQGTAENTEATGATTQESTPTNQDTVGDASPSDAEPATEAKSQGEMPDAPEQPNAQTTDEESDVPALEPGAVESTPEPAADQA